MKIYFSKERTRFEAESTRAECRPFYRAGFKWDVVLWQWYTPSYERAYTLIRFCDDDARWRLERWLRHTARSVKASHAKDSEFKVKSPEGLDYLGYQKAGIEWAVARRSTLIGDDPGLGKTIQAIGTLNSLGNQAFPVLVVCPSSLRINWRIEIEKWSTREGLTVGEITSRASSVPETDVVITSYDLMCSAKIAPALKSRNWATLIADEAHYAKNLSWSHSKGWSGTKRAVVLAQLSEEIDRKIFLTGTPGANRPKELWPLLTILAPKQFPRHRFMNFALRYCNAQRTPFGWDFSGSSNEHELQRVMRSTVMIRRLKSEVLKELPPKRRQIISLDGKSERVPKAGNADLYIDQIEKLGVPKSKIFIEECSEVRHETALRKAPQVAAFCSDLLQSEQKLLVFAHHKDVVDVLESKLKAFNPLTITGSTATLKRQEFVERFQNDPQARVLIGNIQAAGVGLTLTAARTVVFAELDWVPSNMTQAEDRCHRIGQNDNVRVFHVVIDGSLDARIAKVLLKKQAVMDRVLDEEIAKVPEQQETLNAWEQMEPREQQEILKASKHPEIAKVRKEIKLLKLEKASKHTEIAKASKQRKYHEIAKLREQIKQLEKAKRRKEFVDIPKVRKKLKQEEIVRRRKKRKQEGILRPRKQLEIAKVLEQLELAL